MRALLLALMLCTVSAHAAEGMWTLDNLPKADLQKRYGFAPDKAWVDKAMKASVRLAGGCSGSFVSPDGLVLTNHHCINDCVQQLSTSGRNYITDGFLAKTREDEKVCPEIELNRLETITDVTARVGKAVAGKSGAAFATARKAEQAKIEADCTGAKKDTVRCDVVELYQGGRYHLYQYRRFQDVRLAFAPELAIAFFGGDPDNFNFPRYDLDMALLRAYENGKPAVIADYFPLKADGAQDGELTLITGHPGSTQRQLTVAQLELMRDFVLPQRLFQLAELRGLLTQFSADDEENARIAQNDLFGIENSLKARKGMLEALQDPAVFQLKTREEARLRAATGRKPWDEIAKAQTVTRAIYHRYRSLEQTALGSKHFEYARMIVRGAAERAKPNAQRLKEFTDGALPRLEQKLFSSAPVYDELETVKLTWSLTKMRELLGPDDPAVKRALGHASPAQVAERLLDDSDLEDVDTRRELWALDAKTLADSKEPFIQLALALDADARAVRKRYEDEVEAVEHKNAETISAARFKLKGTGVYPDATFTLRLSHGEVKGWQEGETWVPPFTDIAGAFARHTGADPYALPESWLKSKEKLNGKQRFNFVTTNDIIGGNSGSPIINRHAQIVGLVFDGNIRSLGGAFWFDERVNRAVAVHAGAIVEALRSVYGANTLADEMQGLKR